MSTNLSNLSGMTDEELADVLEMAEELRDDYSRTEFSKWDPKTKPKLVDALLLQTKRLVESIKRIEELERRIAEAIEIVEMKTDRVRGHYISWVSAKDGVEYKDSGIDVGVDCLRTTLLEAVFAGALPKGGE